MEYRAGIGRYLDEERTWYVVEDENGNVLRIFYAGMTITNKPPLRRNRLHDLVVAFGEKGALALTEGLTGAWAIGPVNDVADIYKKAEYELSYEPLPLPDERALSDLGQSLLEHVVGRYLIMRGPQRNLLFGVVGPGGTFLWNTLDKLQYPREAYSKLIAGPERPAIVTQLLRRAQIKAEGVPRQPRYEGACAVLAQGMWHRQLSNGARTVIAAEADAAVVDVAGFSRSFCALGWTLSNIKQVTGALDIGDTVVFPVRGAGGASVLVPWAGDRLHHLVLCVDTVQGRGVGGLTVVRAPDGSPRSQTYTGPRAHYFLCPDGTVLALPS